MIDIQVTYLISLKYNFIHYNPFPKVKSTKLKEFYIKIPMMKNLLNILMKKDI